MPGPGLIDRQVGAARVGPHYAIALLLAICMQQDADEFTHHHLVMVIQQLQIRNQLQLGRLEYRTGRNRRGSAFFLAAESKPIDGNMQPVCERTQFVLRRNRFPYQPFARGMHRDRPPGITDIEVPGQFGRAIRRMMGVSQSLLQAQAESLSFGCDFPHSSSYVPDLPHPSSGVMGTTENTWQFQMKARGSTDLVALGKKNNRE